MKKLNLKTLTEGTRNRNQLATGSQQWDLANKY